MQSIIFLTVKNGSKGIPYGRSSERPDGSRNFGFQPLKGRPKEEIIAIPEAQDSNALKNALVVLNDANTPFFTVGCEKVFNGNDSGGGMEGYLELAFNSVELVSDAQFYFKLFYFFNQWYWKQSEAASIRYRFELEGAHFTQGKVDGLTLSVWISTTILPSKEMAMIAWEWGLDMVVDFLKQQAIPSGPYTSIY